MTTSVKVHVDGQYRTTVTQKNADGATILTTVVEGNYDGSPNPSGEGTFSLHHPATASFEIVEEAVPDAPPQPADAADQSGSVPDDSPATDAPAGEATDQPGQQVE